MLKQFEEVEKDTYLNVIDDKYPLIIKADDAKTIAVVTTGEFIGIGVARCNPIDHYNEDIGAGIAIARAIRHIAAQVERTWTDRAKTKDEVIEQRSRKKLK